MILKLHKYFSILIFYKLVYILTLIKSEQIYHSYNYSMIGHNGDALNEQHRDNNENGSDDKVTTTASHLSEIQISGNIEHIKYNHEDIERGYEEFESDDFIGQHNHISDSNDIPPDQKVDETIHGVNQLLSYTNSSRNSIIKSEGQSVFKMQSVKIIFSVNIVCYMFYKYWV